MTWPPDPSSHTDRPGTVIAEDRWRDLLDQARAVGARAAASSSHGQGASRRAARSGAEASLDRTGNALAGLSAPIRQFQAVLLDLGALRHVEAWIGPEGDTLAVHRPDGVHVSATAHAALPSALAAVLDLGPRPRVDPGPQRVPSQLLRALYVGDGELADSLLRRTIGRSSAAALAAGVRDGLWRLSLLSDSGPVDGRWDMRDHLMTLSVPACLCLLTPEDEAPDIALEPVTSAAVWAAITPWLRTERAG